MQLFEASHTADSHVCLSFCEELGVEQDMDVSL